MVDIKQVYEAQRVLTGIIKTTPLVHAEVIHPNLWIKTENLQQTGSFKIRGAYVKMTHLSHEERSKGVIAASAGNHAQGVAYACEKLGIQGTIIMPKTAPLAKISATKSYQNVQVELQGDTFQDAYEYAKHLQSITKATFIEPYNDQDVIAGQGTIGLEILADMEDVDIVLVPVGGGGLISGIASVIKTLHPNCKVYGVEAKEASSMQASLQQKEIVTLKTAATIADGIAVKEVGNLNFDICKSCIDGMISVGEEEIAATILVLLEKMKLVSEGAGAVAIAAALFHKIDIQNKKCVAILSGGNIDINFLSKIIDIGLIKTGRKTTLEMKVLDKPGNLTQVIDCISKQGANIVAIKHHHSEEEILSYTCRVSITIETNHKEHILQVITALNEIGYQVTR